MGLWNFLIYGRGPKWLPADLVVLAASLALGFFFGYAAFPLITEIAEWSQSMAGKVYPNIHNIWRQNEFTLQTLLPAVAILKFGLDEKVLSALAAGLTCALSFGAWSMTSLVFARLPLFNLALPFLFLGYSFFNPHFYPLKFPYYFYVFGQVGFYLALLSFALLALKRYSLAMIAIGFLPLTHAPWAVGMLFGVLALIIGQRRFPGGFKAVVVLLLSAGLSYMGFSRAQERLPRQNYQQTDILGYEEEMKQHFDVQQVKRALVGLEAQKMPLKGTRSKESGVGEPQDEKKAAAQKTFSASSHNQILSEKETPVIEFVSFFQASIWLLVLLLLLYFRERELFTKRWRPAAQVLLGVCGLACLVQLYQEVDRHLSLLSWIHESLPYLVRRTIANRWLNMASAVLPIATFSLLVFYALKRKNIFALLLLPALFYGEDRHLLLDADAMRRFGDSSLFVPRQLVLFGLFLVIAWDRKHHSWFKERWAIFRQQSQRIRVVLVALTLLLVVQTVWEPVRHMVSEARLGRHFNRHDQFAELFANLFYAGGSVITGHAVVGLPNANIQVRSGRPYYFPDDINVPLYDEDDTAINVYCHTSNLDSFDQFETKTKACFRDRKVLTWQYIGKYLRASTVLVLSHYEVGLPAIIKTPVLSLYRIPDIQKVGSP